MLCGWSSGFDKEGSALKWPLVSDCVTEGAAEGMAMSRTVRSSDTACDGARIECIEGSLDGSPSS